MVLAICVGLSGVLAVACLLQVITGREFIRFSKRRRPPARVRREYVGPTVIGAGGVLVGFDRLLLWAPVFMWVGITLTVVMTSRRRARR